MTMEYAAKEETRQIIIDKVVAGDCTLFQSEDYESGSMRLFLRKNKNNFGIFRDVTPCQITEARDPDLLIINLIDSMLEELNKED